MGKEITALKGDAEKLDAVKIAVAAEDPHQACSTS